MLVRRSIYLIASCCVLSISLRAAVAAEVEMRKVPVAKGLASHPAVAA